MQFKHHQVTDHSAPAARVGQRQWSGPPSAPPTIPPIIINPFNRETPSPAIDPRGRPLGQPVTPPRRPDIRL